MARYYRIRPSRLLKGSWVDLNIDVAFGLAAIFESDKDLARLASQKESMAAGIALAANVALKAAP